MSTKDLHQFMSILNLQKGTDLKFQIKFVGLLTAYRYFELLAVGGAKCIGHHALITAGALVGDIEQTQMTVDRRLIGALIGMYLRFGAGTIMDILALYDVLIIMPPLDLQLIGGSSRSGSWRGRHALQGNIGALDSEHVAGFILQYRLG